jgi:hypothetical protein
LKEENGALDIMASTRGSRLIRFCSFALLALASLAAQSFPPSQVSNTFKLEKAKSLRGQLVECDGAIVGSTEIQLLNDKTQLVKSTRSGTLGEYDFGVLGPGKCRVRVDQMVEARKKPRVICMIDGCRIAPLPLVNQLRPEAKPPKCR